MRNARYRCGCQRILAFALIVVGAALLLLSMPGWMWLATLGLAMVVIGILLLRAGW